MKSMTSDEYVLQVVAKYAVSTTAEIYHGMLEPSFRNWAGVYLSRTFISGAYAKGTAVRSSSDIDIFISLKSNYPNLNGMYDSLYQFALNQGWFPRRQNVSLGIQFAGAKIDLVPGRVQEGYLNWHSLYKSKQMTWKQSNIDLQIATVKNSSRTKEIRAIKIWRNLHNLEFPSFYLELAVIEGLKYQPTTTLAQNVLRALTYISQNIVTARILDPGNTNNIISDDLTVSQKVALSSAAANSLREPHWEQIIW
jgi:hypothetical protein